MFIREKQSLIKLSLEGLILDENFDDALVERVRSIRGLILRFCRVIMIISIGCFLTRADETGNSPA